MTLLITELRYSNTNTYLITGRTGTLLFDTGWAGSFPAFRDLLKQHGRKVRDIDIILISHFHPDHMGISQEIADSSGAKIIVLDIQLDHIHDADIIFEKEKRSGFVPIRDEALEVVSEKGSRALLSKYGIDGEVIFTPGHSDDSISLLLDSGELFVGDLNPLYELPLHEGTLVADSWEKLLSKKPKVIYYGHAKAALTEGKKAQKEKSAPDVERILKYAEKGFEIEKICKKTGEEKSIVEDVVRLYLTHPGVGLQGILDRLEYTDFGFVKNGNFMQYKI